MESTRRERVRRAIYGENLDQLDQYPLPDPTDGRLYRAVGAAVRERRGGRFILGDHGCTLFERAWVLRFWGGISTQRVLPLGDPSEVRAEVRERIEVLGREGRYIIAPAHDLLPDIPMANFEALVETVGERR